MKVTLLGDVMSSLALRTSTSIVTAAACIAGGVTATGVAHADPGGIVISEVNYHAGSDLDTDDFLELVNTGPAPIDMSGWTFTAGITATLPSGSVVPAGGYFVLSPDAARFEVVYGFAPDAVYTGKLSNGGETVTLSDGVTTVDEVSYLDQAPWTPLPDGNGPSLELRDLGYENTLPENWGASEVTGGTPGTVNSIDGTPPSPVAGSTVATPLHPQPNEDVVVTAALPLGSTATLKYKVMYGADVSVPFRDDASSPGGAGDGVYAGTIPGQGAGLLVRYRVDATTSGGIPFSSPAADDTINYHGVVVNDPGVTTDLPVFKWFMSDAVYNDILANHRYDNVTGPAVIAYGDQVIDNAQMRVRGQSSRDDAKVNWKVALPSGYTLDFSPNVAYPLDEFALQADVTPTTLIAWDTVGAAGARRLGIFSVRTERNGDFFSVGMVMETEDGSWRDDQGVDDWAIYKGNYGALNTASSPAALAAQTYAGCPLCQPEERLEKKTRETEDYTDVWQLTQALSTSSTSAQRAWLRANVNIPELVNYMALNVVMRHEDSNWKNWWVARDTEGTGRWEMWHWDLNRSWINTTASVGRPFITPDTANKLLKAGMADPEIREMYFRRLRTLADQFLTPGDYEAQWDAYASRYLSDWQLENNKWGGFTPTVARNRFVERIADRRTIIANNTAPRGEVPPSQSANPTVVINEIQYQPTAGTAAEFIELTNPSNTEAIDISGWTIDGIDLAIQPGVVLLPGDQISFVKDDVTFRATYGSNRFVGGEYPGDLSDAGETIRLLQGARVVDEVTYAPGAPWPLAAAGSGPSLELSSPSLDNALPASWTATSGSGGTPSQPNTDGGDPPPSVLYSDSFTGADGATWPGPWSVSSTNGGSVTLQANAGQLSVPNTTGAYARALLASVPAVADTEVLFAYTWNSGGPKAVFNVTLRGSGGWGGTYRPRNGYALQFTSNTGTVGIKRNLNGSVSTLRSTTGAQSVGSAKQWVRLQVTGSTIRYRVWLDGQPEPSGWTASVTDSGVSTPGQLFVSLVRSSGATQAKTIALDDLVYSSL